MLTGSTLVLPEPVPLPGYVTQRGGRPGKGDHHPLSRYGRSALLSVHRTRGTTTAGRYSREIEDIKVIMKDLAVPIPLETTTVNQDIETFVTQSFSYDGRLKQLAVDPGAKEIIENAIMTKSNGM